VGTGRKKGRGSSPKKKRLVHEKKKREWVSTENTSLLQTADALKVRMQRGSVKNGKEGGSTKPEKGQSAAALGRRICLRGK